MSKMPAKKKSCFQITSVTQAQVAASSITDDTESLEDPDESRTEDVSSEIFDVSRADFEPEACDISSSEETLNNVGETEAPGAMAPHIPQDGQLPTVSAPHNGGFGFRTVAVTGVVHVNQQGLGTAGPAGQSSPAPTGVAQQPATAVAGGGSNATGSTSQPAPAASAVSSSTTSTTSCSSRFRVIKLDHGTGEPFRRGRWTCMEFYERDSEGSVITRTVDSIRHASTLDYNMDRDSGLGVTGGSVAAPSTLSSTGLDPAVDSAYSTASHSHIVEPSPQPQAYSTGHQTASGTTAPSGFQPTGYASVPVAPQSLLPPGTNGMHQGASLQQVQKSPSMPPVSQAQQFAYQPQQQQQQLVSGHQLTSQPSLIPASQADYRQQHLPSLQPTGTAAQTLPVTTLPVGPPVNQGPSPVMTPAAAGVPGLGIAAQAGETAGPGLVAQPVPSPGLLQQAGVGVGGGGVAPVLAGVQQQQPQYQPSGAAPVALPPHAAVPGVQNVPVMGAGGGAAGMPAPAPSAPSTPVTVPNQTPPSTGQPQLSQPQAPHAGNAGALGVQGVPAGFAQPPANVEENRRKSDALPQPSATSGKDLMKPLISEGLQLPSVPAVNSLFGIPISIDGDEDSTSGASVVAIDNKIEQAMDLVKSHLMYAVREEVEVLKEQIKELYERNSVLERENAVLKSLANNDQLSQLFVQSSQQQQQQQPPSHQPPLQPAEASQPQPNVSSA
ncbi:TSC22 domain family protein 2-like [Megalops cyprinoides]|uniref:TSC22 domain family protein 2-like n=1 Tax=Megalops cyprinoides TaxID=118141 RepID=UPI0018645E2C|nr:TSC22 domain family protein 2-like [Megalops cyprinoides]